MCMPNPQASAVALRAMADKPAIFASHEPARRSFSVGGSFFGKALFSLPLLTFTLLATSLPTFVSASAANDTLIGYWKFDETVAGSDATDHSDDGKTATAIGAAGAN